MPHIFVAAGHTFVDDVCTATKPHEDGTQIPCGRKFGDIRHIDMSYVQQPGYAHYGNLTSAEVESVMKENARRAEIYRSATHDVSSGGSVSTPSEESVD